MAWPFPTYLSIVISCCYLITKLCLTPCDPMDWTVVHQTPLTMGFLRQKYWRGLPFPPPEDLPNPEIEPESPALAGGFFTTQPPGKPMANICIYEIITTIIMMNPRVNFFPFVLSYSHLYLVITPSLRQLYKWNHM